MKVSRRNAVIRRKVRQLAAIAEARAAQAERPRPVPGFRPFSDGEAEAVVGADKETLEFAPL